MRVIGFSTGALAKGDFTAAIEMLLGKGINAVELSALRSRELGPLVSALPTLPLRSFSYVSLHVPSNFSGQEEDDIIQLLLDARSKVHAFVLHPDTIHNVVNWKVFGDKLLIENMDKRKPGGRTAEELTKYFEQLPEAGLCFDIGHARQVDSSMNTAYTILQAHGSRLREVHISHVNTQSKHDPLTYDAILSFQELAHLIPENIPVIIESSIRPENISEEVHKTKLALSLQVANNLVHAD
jgi:hypothetical protein